MIKYGIFIQGGESMKKVISLVLATLLCAAVFVGCGSDENNTTSSLESMTSKSSVSIETETKTYSFNDFEIQVPKSWTEKTKNGHTYFYSSVNSDFLQVSIMDDMEDSILLEENQESVIEGIKESMDDYTILSKATPKNGDFEGFRCSYTGKLPSVGDTLYYMDTFSISYNNKFIQILYVSISDQREQASNYFPNILASLKKIETTSLPETNNSAIPSENISSSTAATSSTPKTPTVTTGQKNALNRAKQYLRTMPFSYTGLIEQLEYEQYSHDDAVYAADNCGANWSEQAAKKAKSYLNTMAFSRKGLIEQLQYEGYTYEQAVYATDNCGADWNEQAAKKAQSYLDIMSFSRQGLIDQLQFEGYTYEQAVYGVNQVGL